MHDLKKGYNQAMGLIIFFALILPNIVITLCMEQLSFGIEEVLFILGVLIVCVFFVCIIKKRRNSITIETIRPEIEASLSRICTDSQYADLIIKKQGLQPDAIIHSRNWKYPFKMMNQI